MIISQKEADIIQLDKNIITFYINSLGINPSSQELKFSENVEITNSTSEYVAFEAKTSRKDLYMVKPAVYLLEPNEKKKLEIVFSGTKDDTKDQKEHKFLMVGLIIPKEDKDKNIKELFHQYKENKERMKRVKVRVQFLENNSKEKNLNLASSSVSTGTIYESIKFNEKIEKMKIQDSSNIQSKIVSKQKKLDNLKKDYHKLKEEVENFKKKEEELKEKLENLGNRSKISQENSDNFIKNEADDFISRELFYVAFIISIIVGFYLTK